MRRQVLVNGGLLLLALGTLGVVWATRELPSTADLAARKDKLLPTFSKEAVSCIVLSQHGRELRLDASQSGDFLITKPWSERADIATVNQLLGSLDLASALRPADGVSDAQSGLAQGALRIRLEMGQISQTLTLGGPAPAPAGARYAEVESSGVTRRYVVSQGVATELDLPFDKFREPRLLEYGRNELSKLELSHGGAELELQRGEHGAFFMQLPGGKELASREAVERIFTALSRLSTEHFVELDEAQKALTNAPLRVKLTLSDKSAAPVMLSFGTCPGATDEALVLKQQAGKSGRAGCVPAELASALSVTPEEARLDGPFAARTDEVEELHIARGSAKLDLARKDKAFVLRAPSHYEVALDAGNTRISGILSAKGQRPTTRNLHELGLEPAAGEASIQIAGADEAAHRSEQVQLGQPRSDGSVCLKRNADGVLLCFGADDARLFDPDATLLKGLTLFSFAPSQVASFSVEAPGLNETVRRNSEGGYALEQPKGFKHDGSLVADVVQTIGTLQAARWVAALDDASSGLKAPRLHVTVTLTDGAGLRQLDVGAPTSGGYFARASSDPGVFVLPRSVVDELSTPLVERALLPVPESELSQLQLESAGRSLTMTRSGERWDGPLDADTLEAVLALKAERALHLGAPKPLEGFTKPSLIVRFTSKQGQQYRLLLGANDNLDDSAITYARLDGVDATFALSGRTATMLRDALAPSHPE
jgi:hypothetical protein